MTELIPTILGGGSVALVAFALFVILGFISGVIHSTSEITTWKDRCTRNEALNDKLTVAIDRLSDTIRQELRGNR